MKGSGKSFRGMHIEQSNMKLLKIRKISLTQAPVHCFGEHSESIPRVTKNFVGFTICLCGFVRWPGPQRWLVCGTQFVTAYQAIKPGPILESSNFPQISAALKFNCRQTILFQGNILIFRWICLFIRPNEDLKSIERMKTASIAPISTALIYVLVLVLLLVFNICCFLSMPFQVKYVIRYI